MNVRPVVLFADRLPPLVGGMEMHARYFIEHFTEHARFPLVGIVTRDHEGRDALVDGHTVTTVDLATLQARFDPAVVVFNSGRWIEQLGELRRFLPNSLFVYRTGGNEIIKAPLERASIPDHRERQAVWAATLNDAIDVLITNSSYTEERLRAIGVRCRFLRCVGGVNVSAFPAVARAAPRAPVLFCAARFVPYKNHRLLIDLIGVLTRRGHEVTLRLAGDGPLLDEARAQVATLGLEGRVAFLGELDNLDICRQIAEADGYVQLSGDRTTAVPGGTYVHSEGMGRSFLEALSAGTFVIAGRSGALPEIVTPDRGVLIDLGDAESMATALEPVFRAPLPRSPPTDVYAWGSVFSSYEREWGDR